MNEQDFDANFEDPEDSAFVDVDGQPMNPPVLSMEQAQDVAKGASFPEGLPDLDLSASHAPVLPTSQEVGSNQTQPVVLHTPRTILAESDGKTVVPKGWSLTGNIESSDTVTIGCQVNGQIEMTAGTRIEVLHGASVVGAIRGVDVVIRGYVDGEINAGGGTVSIEEGATILGKVSYTGIRMSGGEHQMELVHVPRQAVTADR